MNETSSEHLHLCIDDDNIAWIEFRRPETLNAISTALAGQLLRAVENIQVRDTVRVIVLRGAGRAFMAGGDLKAFHIDPDAGDRTARSMIEPLHAALRLLEIGDAPVLASLHGAVAGAGMSIALGADLAIAADDTKMSYAYGRIGTSPDGGGSWHITRLLGLRRASEFALLGNTIDAATALSLGLVNRVVAKADLEEQTRLLAKQLARGPTKAFGETRRLLRASSQTSFQHQLDAEQEAFERSALTRDFTEGVAAFFERRPAAFQGR